ncbi:hypothetical protein C804_00350 [Lachnospiraceae bacterium A4]|nr:hypothetical protein C804_00350 [Lachnospiraceae bacterium A4]
MANWGEKFSRATQAAISKSKEMAEVTRLNVEISTYTQNMKDLYTQIGEYVIKEGLLVEDAEVSGKRKEIEILQENIQSDTDKVNEIRNINICPNCGSEVSRSRAEMNREVLMNTIGNENICKNCGAVLAEGAVFCGNCGSKQE